MIDHARLKTLTCCVGTALGALAVVDAHADSGVGVDTVLGNALNPGVLNNVPARDPEGLDSLHYQRSPTGFLYGWPIIKPKSKTASDGNGDTSAGQTAEVKPSSDWSYSGQVEIGGLGVFGDTDNAWFLKYKDVNTGPYLNNFSFKAEQPSSARFIDTYGGGLGYRDQFFGAKTGRYNDWKLDLFYNEIPHVFTSNYRSLWTGLGSSELTLQGLTPGGTLNAATTGAQIAKTLEDVEESQLSILRRKGGFDVEKYLNNQWRLYGGYTLEKREGERPFGAVFGGGGGGGNIEIAESIDYETHDIFAGLRFDDGTNNLNLQTQASLFRNNIDTLTFENPLFITTNTITGVPPTTFTQGVYDLYPDNDYYNLLAEYARSFRDPYQTRLTAVASVSRMRQNDDLIAPTTYSLNGGIINGVSAANVWNTPASLWKDSADAEIDTRLFSLGLSSRPLDQLALQGKIRYYETDNKTKYFACNPLTGQWGRLLNDGSGGSFVTPNVTPGNNPRGTPLTAYNQMGCNVAAVQALGLVPSAGNVKIRNTPYEYKQLNYVLSGDYEINRTSSLFANLEREEYDREYRERDNTWENKVELGYTNRGFDFGSLRVSAEYGHRRGDTYNMEAHPESQSKIFGPEPFANGTNVASWIHAVSGLRKYDLADRDRWTLNGRLNLIATDALDIGLAAQYQTNDYPNSEYGRNDRQNLTTLSLDLNYQPSARFGVFGFYSYQQGEMEQAGVQALSCIIGNFYYFYSDGSIATNATGIAPPPVARNARLTNQVRVTGTNWYETCANASPTSPLYPTSRTWITKSEDYNHTFGVGGRYDFGKARLELDYTYVTGVTKIGYEYNAAALGIVNPDTIALIGSGMPDLEATQQFLDFNLIVPVNKSVAVRALYRYETGTIDDWHYDGVADNPVPAANAVYLDAGPQDYSASIVGLFLQVSF